MIKKVFYNFFLLRIKTSQKTCYQKNKDGILNRKKNYDENDKARLREQERDKYRKLSEEGKYKKREYWKNKIS